MPEIGRFSPGDFNLCVLCAALFQEGPDPALLQLCACRGAKDQEKWPRFDFNEVAILCRCCAGELVRSGTRWSRFFCDVCHARVGGLNVAFGGTVVPVGRHSIMNGIMLSGALVAAEFKSDPDQGEGFNRFVQGLLRVSSMVEHLGVWHREAVRSSLEALGLGRRDVVFLPEYLRRLRAARRRSPDLAGEAMFRRLCAHFGVNSHL